MRRVAAGVLQVVAALIAILGAGWLSAPTAAGAVTQSPEMVHVCTYDGIEVSAVADTAIEHGRPAEDDFGATTRTAVDRWSQCAAVCPSDSTTGGIFDYDEAAPLMRAESKSGSTSEPDQASEESCGVFERWQVAANGVDEAFSAGKYLNDSWYKSTFPNRTQSVQYHLAQHGKGRTAVEYTRDAMDFFAQNQSLGKAVILRDGTAGIKIATKQPLPGECFQL